MTQTLADFLAAAELSTYEAAFREEGWDSVAALRDLSVFDFEQLVEDVSMKNGHRSRLRMAINRLQVEQPEQAAAAESAAAAG